MIYHYTEASKDNSVYKFKHGLAKCGAIKDPNVLEDLYDEPVVPVHLTGYYTCAISLLFNAPSNGFSPVQPSLSDIQLQAELEGVDTSKLIRIVRALYPLFIRWVNEQQDAKSEKPKSTPRVGRSKSDVYI